MDENQTVSTKKCNPIFDKEKWGGKQPASFRSPPPLNKAPIEWREEKKTADSPFLFHPEGKIPHVEAITEKVKPLSPNLVETPFRIHTSRATLGSGELSSLLQ